MHVIGLFMHATNPGYTNHEEPKADNFVLIARSLDANLHTRQGPVRSFLILARYAAQTVYDESIEQLRATSGSLLWPPAHFARFVTAWAQFTKRRIKLDVYEWVLYLRGLVGLANEMPATVGPVPSQ